MNEISKYVGQRIRTRRKALGKSQVLLANEIGITYQQVQQYETGENRGAAPTLWTIASALRVRVDYFFKDLSVEDPGRSPESDGSSELSTVDSPRMLSLMRGFRSLEEQEQRAVIALVNSISGDKTWLSRRATSARRKATNTWHRVNPLGADGTRLFAQTGSISESPLHVLR